MMENSDRKVLRHLDKMLLEIKGMSEFNPGDDELRLQAYKNVPDTSMVRLKNKEYLAKKLFADLDHNSREDRIAVYSQFCDPFMKELEKLIAKKNVRNSQVLKENYLTHSSQIGNNQFEENHHQQNSINGTSVNSESLTSVPTSIHSYRNEKRVPREVSRRYFLRNGKVGQNYLDELDLNQFSEGGDIVSATIENLDLIGGLEFNPGKLTISGIPQNAGKQELNYEFHLKVRFQTPDGEMDAREIVIKVFPDPKSLWKTLEPDDTKTDRKPHEDKIKVQTSMKKADGNFINLIAASKRGRSHAHEGSFRDDHFYTEYSEESGWLIVAVADGAGSSSYSRTGSKIACENAVNSLKNSTLGNFEELLSLISEVKADEKRIKTHLYSILGGAAFESAKKVEEEARSRNLKIRDFYTTLLLLVVRKMDQNYFIAGLGIGDGAICIKADEKNIKLLNKPDGGDFGGQTRFLTMPEVLTAEELFERIRYEIVEDFESIYLMTDGISDPKFETDNNLMNPDYWEKMASELRDEKIIPIEDGSEERLLKWLDFWSEGNHDDRTLAIIQ